MLFLAAIVFNALVGSGVLFLPQVLLGVQQPIRVFIVLGVTIVGSSIFLANFFLWYKNRPNLANGMHDYPAQSFGLLGGFMSTWCYWLSCWLGNIGYLTYAFIVSQTVLEHCHIYLSKADIFTGGSVFIWICFVINIRSVKTSLNFNAMITGLKTIIFIFLLAGLYYCFSHTTFEQNWHHETLQYRDIPWSLSVYSIMSVLLFTFSGVESLTIFANTVKSFKEFVYSSCIGFISFIMIVLAILGFSFGIPSPKGTDKLLSIVGYYFPYWIHISYVISIITVLIGSFFLWFFLSIQTLPLSPLVRLSKIRVAFLTTICMQIFWLVHLFKDSVLQFFINMDTTCLLFSYFLCCFSALFAKQRSITWTIVAVLGSLYTGILYYIAATSQDIMYVLGGSTMLSAGLLFVWFQSSRQIMNKHKIWITIFATLSLGGFIWHII
jgi:arginine:ornithine antiporter / lysine permease